MPLIKFETAKDEEQGGYMMVTSGQVSWFPDSVFGITRGLLEQLEPRFKEKGIRYKVLTHQEAQRLVRSNGK